MADTIKGYVLMVDNKTWMIIGGILLVLCVIAFVKKAVRFALTLLTVCLLAFGASYVNTNVLEANGVRIEGKEIYVMQYHFELDDISNIKVETVGESKAILKIALKNGEVAQLNIPIDRVSVFTSIGKALGVNTTVEKK